MRDRSLDLRRSVCACVAGAWLSTWLPTASGQSPTAPLPPQPPVSPAAAPGSDAPSSLAERLRKMEEVNQEILRQFAALAKQNESLTQQNALLTRKVQELTKRFDDSAGAPRGDQASVRRGGDAGTAVGADATAPSLGESAARPSRSPGGGPSGRAAAGGGTTVGAGAGGRDETAPTVSEDAARPSRIPGGGATGPASRVKFNVTYDQQRYGYLLQSEDQEFELRFNALLQADARIYSDTHMNPVVSDLDLPRTRLYFSGRMTRPFEYQISLQRGTNSLDLLNAYINLHYDDRLQVRVGRFKPPYTFEWYKMSAWEMLAPDRSLFGLNFGPNRMVGAMAWGFLFRERLEYAVGIFDGGRNSYQDFNYAKDVMALVDYKPFFQSGNLALKNLAVGGSFDQGRENNPPAPSVLRTSTPTSTSVLSSPTGDNLVAVPFLAFNSNVRERGDRSLGELYITYFYRGLSLLGVWDFGNNDFALTPPNARPVHLPVGGYFVQAAYLLTGESRERLGLVAPIRPFDVRKGKRGPGAFEVQARFSTLNIGNQVFTGGLADPNLWTDRVEMLDVGFNWYLNKFVKFYFDWENAMFAQPVYDRPGGFQKTNNLFWLRLQIYL